VANPFTYRRKVRFSDTDCQGVVFNANYLVYFDDALTDFLEAIGFPCTEIARRGHDVVTRRAECDFLSGAVLSETLGTSVQVEGIGATSIAFHLRVTEEITGRLVAEGREVYVVVDHATRQPVPVPGYLRCALERFRGG